MSAARVGPPGLSQDRIVAASRELLVEGGQEAVVVREVARRLGVTAPALYRYVAGRDELLTLLITACTDEMTRACATAAAAAGDDPADRLLAASRGFRAWGLAHRAEFALVHGTPIAGYAAPPGGPTTAAQLRFAEVFATIFRALAAQDRLRVPEPGAIPAPLRADLDRKAATLDMSPPVLHVFVGAWQRLLGVVVVEVFGHLAWMYPDGAANFEDQLARLGADIRR